jgi:hypothetical protein
MRWSPGVHFRQFDLLCDDFDTRFDLIFCAEVLYYVDPRQRLHVARRIARWLVPGGDLMLVHSRRRRTRTWSDVYGEGGTERLHRLFTQVLALPVIAEVCMADYTIAVVRAHPPVYPLVRRWYEYANLTALTGYPILRLYLRDWVRQQPRLLTLVRTARWWMKTAHGSWSRR